jgi:ribosomal protein S18 acetylase RimI-like enzyme
MRTKVAQEHDIATTLALVEELLAELGGEGQEFMGIDRDRLQADIGRNLDSGRFLALLAMDESDTAVGVLTLSESFALYAGGEYGVIDEMYVRPQHRGRGVGRALVDEAVAIARQRRWFRLDVTSPGDQSNRRAVRFYAKLGFEFTGEKLRLLV